MGRKDLLELDKELTYWDKIFVRARAEVFHKLKKKQELADEKRKHS